MTPDRLLAHFHRLVEAPDAISRLRRFILDLAVRGTLVEQDPNDEPASELLKQIQAEKARLAKAGEIRKEKPLPLVEPDEPPFGAPAGWEWVHVRQVTSDRGQTIPDQDFTYIDVSAINKEVGCVADARVLSASDAPSRARRLVRKGDLLYSCVRPYLLNIAIIESDIVPSPIASTAFAVLNGFGLILSKYLWIVLRSPFLIESVEAKMRGQAYPAINDSDFAMLPVPLPPLAEQHRIVAKVDELMALCDRLEAAQVERERRRDRLAAASLHRLNQPADAAFREHVRFHLRHFPCLTTSPDQIPAMRQTILNLAVSGRLVAQDPNDEPASDLLKRIAAEKARLIKEKRLKRQKSLLPIQYQDLPFKVPIGWSWARADDISLNITDGFHNSPTPVADGRPYITAKHVRPAAIDFGKCLYVAEKNHRELFAKTHVRRGDILVVNIGAGCGTPAVVEVDFEFSFKNVAVMNLPSGLDQKYVFHFLMSYRTLVFRDLIKGGAQPFLGLGMLREMLIPLPPLAEQHRIVAKVEELMALCDRLEAQLTTAQSESRRLLEAVLREALATAVSSGTNGVGLCLWY